MSEASAPAPPKSSRKTKWFAFAAIGVAAATFLFIAFGGIGKNLVYYWGPKELRAAGHKAVGATIRLGGQVAPGSVKLGDGVSNLEFDVTDGTATVHVVSRGVPPQLFRDRIGVVVEGTMTSAGIFESQRLMVSHDNQYRAPGDRNVDIKTLMRSTQGIDDPPAPQPVVAGPAPR
ncbi:MAG TPA: cytochrome c maturation protein CcmE [Myxococcales bacterium]|nr:cytochrome c maturation protein CcmE [Myxococcales bacterium]